MKKAYTEDEENNLRFKSLIEGKEYSPILPDWDQYGVRVMPMDRELEIGDIEMKESRYYTITLLQQICIGIVEIIHFFTARRSLPTQGTPSFSPSLTQIQPSPLSQPRQMQSSSESIPVPNESIAFTEPFVSLILRYINGIFDCGDLFQVDESRSKDQVVVMHSFHLVGSTDSSFR